MKWAFGIKQKVTAALILAATFLLIFLKNRMDRQQLMELNASLLSVYEDRLLVESYIFRLSEILHTKRVLLYRPEDEAKLPGDSLLRVQNEMVKLLLSDYEKTKITAEENVAFFRLKGSLKRIQDFEALYPEQAGNRPEVKMQLISEFDNAYIYLQQLSAIQLSEAKKLQMQSKKMIAGADLWSELEFAVLILVALIIQVMIFASQSLRLPGDMNSPGLN